MRDMLAFRVIEIGHMEKRKSPATTNLLKLALTQGRFHGLVAESAIDFAEDKVLSAQPGLSTSNCQTHDRKLHNYADTISCSQLAPPALSANLQGIRAALICRDHGQEKTSRAVERASRVCSLLSRKFHLQCYLIG